MVECGYQILLTIYNGGRISYISTNFMYILYVYVLLCFVCQCVCVQVFVVFGARESISKILAPQPITIMLHCDKLENGLTSQLIFHWQMRFIKRLKGRQRDSAVDSMARHVDYARQQAEAPLYPPAAPC